MTIITITSTLSHRYLMNKSKDDLARWIMEDNRRLTNLYQAILKHGSHTPECTPQPVYNCACGFKVLKDQAEAWLEPNARGDVP